MNRIKDILHKNGLVRTSCREEIVHALASSATPLSEHEIKSSIQDSFDRTTIYRTFKTLIAKGIIHKIVIDNTMMKYALSQNPEPEKQHAHFYCMSCKKVFCLPSVKWDYSQLPDLYRATEAELLIKGYCNNCK
jgi:Fur family ferric uptake transcriptional regulator